MSGNNEVVAAPAKKGLGTFAGVFTPSILTILGIILFLRMGFVVGTAGLWMSLFVILLANLVSVLTSFSLAAIATNFKVKGGGDYYLISRTLGPEFGGAIGIVLFLAQSVSIAFYAIGFGEGLTSLVNLGQYGPQAVALAAIAGLFLLAWLGADWATKFQYGIMAILFGAITVFAVGAFQAWDPAQLRANMTPGGDMPFWVLFALFFPAVTGFTQGVSMSGDLEDPAKSLPLGTFAAVALSIIVYFGVAVLFAGALPNGELAADYDAMRRIASLPWLVSAGVFAATLSSALASFLGAPRILQALASDKLFRFLNPFASLSADGNPRRAILFSLTIAIGTVLLGDLNLVAPIVSMFFLISYGLLNYATYFEASAASPSFRPRFKWYNKRFSLLGCLVCGGLMLAIDPAAGGIAIVLLLAIHQYLARSVQADRWADSSRSALFQRIRKDMLAMSAIDEHDRDWRPVILAFSDAPERRERIVRFAGWIEGGSGITTAVRFLSGEGPLVRRERAEAQAEIEQDIQHRGLQTFVRVISASDPTAGFPVALQASGLGPIRPNIALFNWFDREGYATDAPALRSYGNHLRTAVRQDCNVVVLLARAEQFEQLLTSGERKRRIDVWWHDDGSSRLALLLAYLMTRTEVWSGASLRVLSPDTGEDMELHQQHLKETLDEVRIPAETVVVDSPDWAGMIGAASDASFLLAPFRVRTEGLFDPFGEALPADVEGLPPMAFVLAARDIDLVSEPDEGQQADKARARDAFEQADKLAKERQSELEKARALVAAAEAVLEGVGADAAAEEVERLAKELEQARSSVGDAERSAAKAQVKADALAESAGLPPEDAPEAEAEGKAEAQAGPKEESTPT